MASSTLIDEPAHRAQHPLNAGEFVPPEAFETIRRRMMLHYCKWDAQVEDIATLANFPLLIDRADWNHLSKLAEALSAELADAEEELARRPELHRRLAVPHRIRTVLRDALRLGPTPCAVRVLRFDFHWTRDGWRISEVNSDVPGGFAEASDFPQLMASFVPGAEPTGNPGDRWVEALGSLASPGAHVALLCAPGFMEDQQVVSYLAKLLEKRGAVAHFARVEQLSWQAGLACLVNATTRFPLSAIIRFHQAEWLTAHHCSKWSYFFAGGRTPVSNPGVAVLTESKRFPLVWDTLSAQLPTWRKLLPTTCHPRDVHWRTDKGYLLKTAFCNTGDTVIARDWTTKERWRKACIDAWLWSNQWIAQRRFDSIPVPTPAGDRIPCVGVYTINGRSAGAYVRLSRGPVVDYRAVDAALLVRDGFRAQSHEEHGE